MLIKLRPNQIVNNLPSEEDLLDMSKMESLYVIRRLRAALFYTGDDEVFSVGDKLENGQVYIEAFDIWITENEYTVERD
jgi:hypothetical protein